MFWFILQASKLKYCKKNIFDILDKAFRHSIKKNSVMLRTNSFVRVFSENIQVSEIFMRLKICSYTLCTDLEKCKVTNTQYKSDRKKCACNTFCIQMLPTNTSWQQLWSDECSAILQRVYPKKLQGSLRQSKQNQNLLKTVDFEATQKASLRNDNGFRELYKHKKIQENLA